jgi:hypothetical protein
MSCARILPACLLPLSLAALLAGCGGSGSSSSTSASSASSSSSLVSISLTPADSTVALGGSVSFGAVGTYSDNSTRDLTASVTWSSSATSVATVSNASGCNGTATAVSAGSTVISASTGTISASTSLAVSGEASVANVLPVSVNGSLCSSATSSGYLNKPCVSVTVCNPDGSACQTVNDILLDTGSYGLRIFKQAIAGLTLSQVASGSGSLAGCVQFADGSSLWGPVQVARVKLGSEPAVQLPIQVIDSSFGTRPSGCSNADADPASAGLTGILGVGAFAEDCGAGCVSSAANGMYYRCVGATCTGATVALANQVKNPVASLSRDNNGLLVQLPTVALGGASSLTGSLVLGIGTQSNNSSTSATVIPTDDNGYFRTVFNGVSSDSFLDTGSNALFIPNLDPYDLPSCNSYPDWYCPSSTRTLSSTVIGAAGSPSLTLPFTVGKFSSLVNSSNNVFGEIAGNSTFGFDWGLPFFMGRNVYVGFEGRSGLGSTGPFVAY